VTSVYAGNPFYEDRLRGLFAGLASCGYDAAEAQLRALRVIDGQVQRQAAMLAYNDCWLIILVSFLVVIPAVFLLRNTKGGVAPAEAH
jgi:DHA2 family multidrug resistance protein